MPFPFQIEDPEEWVIDITLGFLMACALLGLCLVIFLLSPLPRSDWIQRVPVRDTATSCFKVLVSVNMMLLVPLIFFTAAEHAFLITAYTKVSETVDGCLFCVPLGAAVTR